MYISEIQAPDTLHQELRTSDDIDLSNSKDNVTTKLIHKTRAAFEKCRQACKLGLANQIVRNKVKIAKINKCRLANRLKRLQNYVRNNIMHN